MERNILFGLAIASVIGLLIIAGSSAAHETNTGYSSYGMHGNMMNGMGSMTEMTAEEMDQNNDGICDMCGMPVEGCEGMMNGMENGMPSNHMGMMKHMENMYGGGY